MVYSIFFYLMLIGFGGLTALTTGKQLIIGLLLLVVNYLIFKK